MTRNRAAVLDGKDWVDDMDLGGGADWLAAYMTQGFSSSSGGISFRISGRS